MTYPAFDAKELTGMALLKDRSLMEVWKWASNEGEVQAVSLGGTNYVIVKDDDLAQRVREVAPKLREYRYDPDRQALVQ
ncbi:MAG: hypothetical protein U5L04_14295 [Trueperaceae bacterium]|nr:hypothetical protein [Trueperaceae bacterium]